MDWNQSSLDFYKSIGATPILHRSVFRITGSPLVNRPAINWLEKSEVRIIPVDIIPSELDQGLKGIELVNASNDETLSALYYTLTFTTFRATPVFLVTEMVHNRNPVNLQLLFEYLVHQAVELGYSRVDIWVNKSADEEIVDMLVNEFRAVEMSGWIPFSLSGDALMALAKRIV